MEGITHRVAEERSLALHLEVALRIRAQPGLLNSARTRVQGWSEDGSVATHWVNVWSELLSRSLEEVVTAITDQGETGRSLRQTSPFAGVIDAKTRWAILRQCEKERQSHET